MPSFIVVGSDQTSTSPDSTMLSPAQERAICLSFTSTSSFSSTIDTTTCTWYIVGDQAQRFSVIARPSQETTTSVVYSSSFVNVASWSMSWNGTGCIDYSELNARNKLREFKERIRARTAARSSIKKALKLISRIGFEEEARIFLKGDSIEVAHPDSMLKFVLERYPDSLIDLTIRPGYSTPYKLSLYTKSDIHIADLCVYMRDTPVLDQVLALAMFIKTGDEEYVLSKANWFKKVNDPELFEILALEYPSLRPKIGLRT